MTTMLYQQYQACSDAILPLHLAARAASAALNRNWWGLEGAASLRRLAAACEVLHRLRLTHERPDFRIASVEAGGRAVPVHERVRLETPFGRLLRFEKAAVPDEPKVLVVAPMSGHFATLLRETVRTLLADHDVHITNWYNARDVPLACGRFGFDEYVEHLMRFLEHMGRAHVVAVCQPCVPTLAAVALLAKRDSPAQPRSMTLMAGPIDVRINPTRVNALATERPIEWFERNLVGIVPARYRGALRPVYPGALQLTAFMSMNMRRHVEAFHRLFDHLADGEAEKAAQIRDFYEEYLAVADLPAEFYVETVRRVFQDCELARGEMRWRGERVDPSAIRRTALMTVEGERDDICSVGQTVAAHDLCSSVPPYLRAHHVQTGVGHYGVFSGRRWSREIYPRVREMIYLRH